MLSNSSHYEPLTLQDLDGLSERLHALSSLNLEIEKGIGRLGSRRDTSSFRSQLHDCVSRAADLASKVGHELPEFSGRNKDKMRHVFARELRRLQQLGRDLAMQERRILTIAQMDAAERESEHETVDIPEGDQREQIAMEVSQAERQMIEERKSALKEIESDVIQLNDMMKDLSYLVDEQQEFIDSIESNITHSKGNVSKGESEITRAARWQSQSRKRLCVLLFVFLGVMVILVSLVYILR